MTIKITTIGGGNGQSNLLDGFNEYLNKDFELKSIVSMSDDGRTTGVLMRAFDENLSIHLPPPGDLRRCLFSLSKSKFKTTFENYFETVLDFDGNISNYSILDILNKLGIKKEFLDYISRFGDDFLDFKIPLYVEISGHKFGNLVMAILFYNFDKDYDKMLDFMHKVMDVGGRVIPVTTKRAYIKATLGNGEVIETQDHISNVADYSSGIADLSLMDCSKDATHTKQVHDSIVESNYLIIGPGDLYTSIISNFIIAGVKESVLESTAKIIFIGNSTNKGGETMGLTQLDFVNKIERYLGKQIDYIILNNSKPEMSENEKEQFKNDISVKGGDYLILSEGEKLELEENGTKVIETDLLGLNKNYKYDKNRLIETILSVLN